MRGEQTPGPVERALPGHSGSEKQRQQLLVRQRRRAEPAQPLPRSLPRRQVLDSNDTSSRRFCHGNDGAGIGGTEDSAIMAYRERELQPACPRRVDRRRRRAPRGGDPVAVGLPLFRKAAGGYRRSQAGVHVRLPDRHVPVAVAPADPPPLALSAMRRV